jgi:protein TonB
VAPSVTISVIVHVAASIVALVILHLGAPGVSGTLADQDIGRHEPLSLPRIVFFGDLPDGGGGGGGNGQTGPIHRAESKGRDGMTLRIAKPITPEKLVRDNTPTVPPLVLDARPLASGFAEQVGLPEGGVTFGTSTGPGSGGGVGTGIGTGIGSGRGPGLGAGSGGGAGGGVYRAGGAVTPPQVRLQVSPSYTSDALEHHIQGSVTLMLIVTRDGEPSDIRVTRSIDPGLDREAVKAVSQWRFTPGRLSGVPVAVAVSVIVDFSIH